MKAPLLILLTALAVVSAASIFIRETLFVSAIGIGAAILAAFAASDRLVQAQRLNCRTSLAVVAGALLISSVSVSNLPLTLTFRAYEARFNALARDLEQGARVEFPRRIGPFLLRSGDKASGTTFLVTTARNSRLGGFARDPAGRGFDLWSISRLGADWAYISER
jgi:hypothetical protein